MPAAKWDMTGRKLLNKELGKRPIYRKSERLTKSRQMEVRTIPHNRAERERLRAEQDQRYGPGYIHTREARVTIAPRDNRSVELSFSSEEPVRRYDWWEDQYYNEILSHTDSVDLTRILEIGVLLWYHDPDHPIGRIENAWIDETD